MALGDAITVGDTSTKLAPEIAQWLVEVRVEMELSKPTRFALRFEDDLCGGDYEIVSQRQFTGDTLSQGTMIGIFATIGDSASPDVGRQCLVYGPITEIKSASAPGGTGSWTETHGEDRRIMMSHNGVSGNYVGLASDTVDQILQGYSFATKVQPTLIHYDGKARKLTQSGDDLSFIEGLARRNNMEFWLEYGVDDKTIPETAHFYTSPERPMAESPTAQTVPQLPVLKPNTGRIIRVQMPPGQCGGGVTKFDAHIDFEKPTAVQAFTLSADGKKAAQQIVQNNESFDPQRPPPLFSGRTLLQTNPPPDDEEAYLAVETTVLDQSWFVTVDCSTTLHLANFLVRPHQILTVQNAGKILSGAYQVTKATHVINAADHFMDFTIRANGLGTAS